MSRATTKVGNSLGDLDEFTQHRVNDIAGRWQASKKAHQRSERLLWLGTMAAEFDDDELAILGFMGFLCQWDHDLMRSAGRPIGQWPPVPAIEHPDSEGDAG